LCVLHFSPVSIAQTPTISPISAQSAFPNESICLNVSLTNTGAPGFGPYLQMIIPKGLTFNSSSLFGSGITPINMGLFPPAPLNQLPDILINQQVTGPQGARLLLLQPPIGSVVTGGPALNIQICYTIDLNALVGVPLATTILPVYQFGDTATGDNGFILGNPIQFDTTPKLVRFSKGNNAPESERPPGPSWPVSYSLVADVATAKSVNNVVIVDTLPTNFVLDAASVMVTGGINCAVTTGMNLQVNCNSINGTGGVDLTVSYSGFFADVLDQSNCITATATNTATFDADFLGTAISTLSGSSQLQIEHLSIQKSATAGSSVIPGSVITFSLAIQLSDFATANDIQIQDILPDGYSYVFGSETANFGLISASVLNNSPSNGATTLNFDVTSITGNLAPGSALALSYQASIDASYFNGDPVLANDGFINTVVNNYDLTAGASACSDNSAATVKIVPVAISKAIVTIGPYQPGGIVTYRLSMDIPSGDTNNIIFSDFFPLPVFVATGINTANFGPGFAVRFSSDNTLSAIAPTSMTVDAGTNSLVVSWPNISTATPQVLSIDVDVVVTTNPFDDNLKLSNVFRAVTENSDAIQTNGVTPAIIRVRAPKIVITKGVSVAEQGIISPLPSILPIDGDVVGVDAADQVTFVVTVENQGGAKAFDVTITDPIVPEFSACNISAIMDGIGANLGVTGLLSTGLTLTAPLAANDGSIGAPYGADTAFFTYVCTLKGNLEVTNIITNIVDVSYAADVAAPILPISSDSASVTVAIPTIAKTLGMTLPNDDGNNATVTIGETIQYQVVLTIPEAVTPMAVLTDTLDAGLKIQSFDSIVATAGLTTDHVGGFAAVVTDATGIGSTSASFPLGTITNSNTDNATVDTITILYTVVVEDVVANVDGANRNNSATLAFIGGNLTDTAQDVLIREPDLSINKSVLPTSADAGDIVGYTITITNTGTSSAHNVVITDNISNAFLNFVAGSVSTTSGVVTTGNTISDTTVQVDVASIPVNGTVTVKFDVILDATTLSGAIINNSASASFDSLLVGGRTYTPVTDTATLNVVAALVIKTVFPLSSSEQSGGVSNQGNPALVDLTIGEEVTFRIVATLAEGVSPSVIITDTLPNNAAGRMDLVHALLVNTGANLLASNPAPVANIGPSNVVSFDFGSVINIADGVVNSDDQIIIDVAAVVVDAAVNSGLEVLTNNVLVQHNAGLTASTSVDVEVVEPRLIINKSSPRTTADAGDIITFSITIDNLLANNSQANAFDVVLSDVIPVDYIYIPATLMQIAGPPADAGSLTVNGTTLQANWAQFDLGSTVEIIYQVQLDSAVLAQKNITNTANLIWTSLPYPDSRERNGATSEKHTITVTAPGLDKVVFSTSEVSYGPSVNGPEEDLLIGEEVTYRFTVTIPEGTSLSATAVDQLPTVSAVMEVVNSQIVSIGTQLSVPGAYVGPTITDTDMDTYNDNVTWNLGDVFNMPDGVTDGNDQIVFEVVAILVDEAVNQNGGNDIINTATFNTAGTTLTATALIDIIEPVINVNKTIVPASFISHSGDILNYQITINHDMTSNADAFNFIVTDTLPTPGTNWINDVTVNSTCGTLAIDSSTAPSISFVFSELTLYDDNCVINYQVQVDNNIYPNTNYQNTVAVSYTSTSIIDVETRTKTSMDSSSFITSVPAIVKVSASSSLAETGHAAGDGLLPDLAIGEEIDFTLTVTFPEGITTNAVVVDNLPLMASGGVLEAISATVDSLGANLSSTLPGTAVISYSAASPYNDTFTFDFGTVINTPDLIVNRDDQMVITVTARVVNTGSNIDLEILSNNAVFTFGAANMVTDSADIEIVEANLSLSKSMGPMVDYVVPITLTLANTGNAPAFDLVIEDVFDTNIWDVVTIVEVAIPVGFTLSSNVIPIANQQIISIVSNNGLASPAVTIGPGEVLVFSFALSLREDVILPAVLFNTAILTQASSLPGYDPHEIDLSGIAAMASLPLPFLDSDKGVTLLADSNASGAASPGEVLEYTITVINSGTATANTVVLADSPDANVTLINGSVTSTQGVVTTGNGVGDTFIDIAIGAIQAFQTVTISYQVSINNPLADGVSAISNQGLVSSDEVPDLLTDDPATATNDDPTVIPVDAAPDLLVSKDDGGTTTMAGGVVVYTISYSNIGSQDATAVVITETVPANSSFNPASSTGSWNCLPDNSAGSSCSQVIGNVNAGAPIATVDFAVTVDLPIAAAVTTLFNNVSIIDDGNNGADLDPSNNSGADTTPITSAADLQISKDDGGISVIPGGTVIYALTYTNVGGQDATAVVITETVAANSSFNPAASTAGWACTPDNSAASVCSISVGNVAGNGGSGSVAFAVTVDTPLAAGVTQLNNSASIAANGVDPTPGDNSASDTTPVNALPDFVINKTDNNAVAAPGGSLFYDLNYDNIGDQNATGVVITEVVPANTIFSVAGSSAPWVCTPDASAGSICQFAIGNLAVGAGGNIQFAVIVDNPLTSGVVAILNSVSIADDGANGADPNPGNNTDGENTPLSAASPDLTVSKDDGGVSVAAGDTVVYVINFANIGNQNSTGIEITETVPANTVFNPTASSAGWLCVPDNNPGSSCVFTIAALNGGGDSGSINFAVAVDNPLAAGIDTISNSVFIADDGNNGVDSDPANNNGSDTTPVAGVPDLNINKVDQSENIPAGGTVIYDISYQNVGSQDATGVVITETVPANTVYTAASSSTGWVCTPDNNAGSICTFNVGNLTVAAGAQVIQFGVIIDTPLAAGVDDINNVVSIIDDGANGVDPTADDNSDPEDTVVVAAPDLAITKTDGDISSGPGQTIVYTLSYENIGDQDATGVVINETVPANTHFNASASSVPWVCIPDNQAGSACQHTVGALNAGDSGNVTFAVDVDDPLATGVNRIVNTVSIADDGNNGDDSDPANNNASDDTSLRLGPPVGIKTGEFDENNRKLIHWTVWWFNPNNNRDLPIFVFDPIPANTTYVGNQSCSADGSSTCTTPVYDPATKRLTLSAVLGQDQGAPPNPTPGDLNNEIVLRFDTVAIAGSSITVQNQAFANWDENDDGDAGDDANGGQGPIPTDDPVTSENNDPTVLETAFPIPAMSFWAILLLMLLMLGVITRKKRSN
jgi:uncharacterized repeat protein (TIGR01451 family)/fimbrial isopeptide formation D2 family protein